MPTLKDHNGNCNFNILLLIDNTAYTLHSTVSLGHIMVCFFDLSFHFSQYQPLADIQHPPQQLLHRLS